MKHLSNKWLFLLLSMVFIFFSGFLLKPQFMLPKTWDLKELGKAVLSPADTSAKIEFVPEDYYYQIPEWEIYKSFPVYVKGREPKGYLDSLRTLEPVKITIEPQLMKSQQDWVNAGEVVFNWPITRRRIIKGKESDVNLDSMSKKHFEVTKQGIYPFSRYIVSQKGQVTIAESSCATCHTKVTADGNIIAGAQGSVAFDFDTPIFIKKNHLPSEAIKEGLKQLMYTPWAKNEKDKYDQLDIPDLLQSLGSEPQGVITRQGIGLFNPLSIPSLIGIKDIKYLDKTGLMKNRGPADLMRYAALNQGMDMLTSYNGYIPSGIKNHSALPKPDAWKHPFGNAAKRYSEAQLYALTQYLYSLKPPQNQNHFKVENVHRGQILFIQQGCVSCHTPPLYTNNKLTPASGYEPTQSDFKKEDIFNVSVETDSASTMSSRRGTGFYKVPSLRGVWYREDFLHNGELATLEDLFDSKRLSPDYVPTGFIPMGKKHVAVKGHEFGLNLKPQEKSEMIMFLKTL